MIGAKRRSACGSVRVLVSSGKPAPWFVLFLTRIDEGGGRCGKPRTVRFSKDLWKPFWGFHGSGSVHGLAYASAAFFGGGSLRREGPVSAIGCARWTRRSRIASATVGSPR